MKKIIELSKGLLLGVIFSTTFQLANATTSFSFNVSEGQGGGDNEFYHGRCVRADVILDTDGHDTGGADLEINYNNSRIAIVNSDCSTPATTIYPGSLYDNYTNNHVTSNKITLGAYNNPGNSYSGNGRFAYFYFTVLDGAGNYDLEFEFMPGDTTDTNLAELGTGNDILEHAGSYALHFADDDNIPYLNNLNPNNGIGGVSVVSNIFYRLNDDDAGIDFSTLQQSLSGVNWGTTTYSAGSSQISHSCHITNANRVPYCDITLNPSRNLWYCEHYTVDTTISDLGNPTVHTLNNYTYTFDTESDNDAPILINLNPNDDAGNVSGNTNINFDIQDVANLGGYPGTGINISTLTVNVSAVGWGSATYTTSSPELTVNPTGVNDYGNVYFYNISIDPAVDFPENTNVTVTVDVNDYGCPTVNHLHRQYAFTTADTTGPVCQLFTPTPGVVNVGTGDNVTFHCTDSGVGVDINTVSAVIDGITYTVSGINQFTYTGAPSDYFITVNPVGDFDLNYAWAVIVNGRDFSGNQAKQVSFGLASGVSGTCPVCEECEECDDGCEEKTIVKEKKIIEYQQCNPIIQEAIKEKELPKTKISNSQIKSIQLRAINDVDIHVGNSQNGLLTSIIGGKEEVLVTVYDNKVIFEGMAPANTMVTLMIESTPIIVTGLADNKGNWKIEMANIFSNGIHKVSAVTLSEDNYIVNTKYLADFKVVKYKNWWCWLLVLILLLFIWMVYQKYRKCRKKYYKLKLKESK